MRRRVVGTIVLACALGMLVSLELVWVHYEVHTDPAHSSVCSLSAEVDCDVVSASAWSSVFAVPNALWAFLCYAGLFWLARRAQSAEGAEADEGTGRFPSAPLAWIFWLSIAMAGYTAWLVFVSFSRLGSFCLFCAVLWGVNATLLVAVSVGLRVVRPLDVFRREPAAILRAPRRAVVVMAVPVLVVVAALLVVPRLYPTEGRAVLGDVVVLTEADLPEGLAIRGPAEAPHLLVLVSDYRCPFCRVAHDVVEKVRRLHPDRLRVVHVDFPLESGCNKLVEGTIHPGACLSARAAACAGRQGRFWEMSDALYAVDDWSDDAPMAIAHKIDLDIERFSQCTASPEMTQPTIERCVRLAERLGVDGTPTLYFDGREHLGAMTVPELLALIQD